MMQNSSVVPGVGDKGSAEGERAVKVACKVELRVEAGKVESRVEGGKDGTSCAEELWGMLPSMGGWTELKGG